MKLNHLPKSDISKAIQQALDLASAMLNDKEDRFYLGASALGDECLARAWFTYRKVKANYIPPRLSRLFDRGKREEAFVKTLLTNAGFNYLSEQEHFEDYHGHFKGSGDGIIQPVSQELIDALGPDPILLEIKTCSRANYNSVIKLGVQLHYPKYYMQMQIYMHYFGLQKALFYCVCKDDDSIHFEIVDYNPDYEGVVKTRVETIIQSKTKPEGISQNPSYYKCTACEFKGLCWENKSIENKDRLCMNCQNLIMVDDGQFACNEIDDYVARKREVHKQALTCPHYKPLL